MLKPETPKDTDYYSIHIYPDSLDCYILLVLQISFSFVCQAHIRELEEEVKLLKNLSHPNIVVSILFNS